MLKNASGELIAVEWEDALIAVSKTIKAAGRDIGAVVGGLVDAEVTEFKLSVYLSVWQSMGTGYNFQKFEHIKYPTEVISVSL
jgi:hypothetical protein